MNVLEKISYDVCMYMIRDYPKIEDIRGAREFIEGKIVELAGDVPFPFTDRQLEGVCRPTEQKGEV